MKARKLTSLFLALVLTFAFVPMFSATPTIANGESPELIQFGNLTWRVLDVDEANNRKLIITESIIEQRRYNVRANITWETSEIRAHLNGEFLNSFDETDRARILQTAVINDDNPWFETNGGNDTQDHIFLLSIDEVVRYFGNSGQLINRPGTANSIDDQYNGNRIARLSNGTQYWWWLRSPGTSLNGAAGVNSVGRVRVNGAIVDYAPGGVRPALWLAFCDECEKHPCECPCEHCEKHPCECPCEHCEKHPCECCGDCGKFPCECPEIIQFGDRDWRVLYTDTANNRKLIITENVIEERRYHSWNDVTWETSEMRQHLNGTFLNSFNETDRARILLTEVINNDNPWFDTTGGDDTEDYIFLLSLDEIVQYFGDSGQLAGRPSNAVLFSDQYNESRIARLNDSVIAWWLRSPGSGLLFAADIDRDGRVLVDGRSVSLTTTRGVRPALWLAPCSVCDFFASECCPDCDKCPCACPETIIFGDITWRVLYTDTENNRKLIITESITENRAYHSTSTDITWETSTIRQHLNGIFLNNFNETDRARILEAEVINNDNPWFETAGGSNTQDHIFLLSLDEVVQYFGDSEQLANRPDDASHINDQYNENRIARNATGPASWWWLRSPGSSPNVAARVLANGDVHVAGFDVQRGEGGVRPALWLELPTCPPGPTTNSGIDYTPWQAENHLIINSTSTDTATINLTTETIDLAGFTPTQFSINGGQRWRNVRADGTTFTTRFPAMLNRGMTLHLRDSSEETATIITFPQINRRPRAPRVQINFLKDHDPTGQTPGYWLLTDRPRRGTAPTVQRDANIQLAVPEFNHRNRPTRLPNDQGWGQFFNGEGDRGIPVLSLPENNRVTRTRYLVRYAPATGQDNTFTPASRTGRVNVSSERRPTRLRVNENRGTLTVRANTFVQLPGQETPTLHPARIAIDVSEVTGRIYVRQAPSLNGRRPVSARQIIAR